MAAERRVVSRVVTDEAGWAGLRPAWEELHRSRAEASPFLQFAWLRTWWDEYGETYGAGGLRIVTMWHDSRLVGALPLYMSRPGRLQARCLRFISTGEAEIEETCPDYLDLLSRPGFEAECADLVWREIDRLEWDRLELLDLPVASALIGSARRPGRARLTARGACPVADLTGGFDAYLGRLSANSRQQARRLLREAQHAGARFELATADESRAAFDDLIRLHQERWAADGRPGAFAAGRFVEFHRRLIREWLPEGRAVLGRFVLDNAPVAVLYGFITGRVFAFYQSGVQHESARLRSPGNAAHLLLMRELAGRGIEAYDFLRGAASYKERLATRENRLTAISVRRATLRQAASWPIELAGRVARRHRFSTAGALP